jgi:hypothetical protein
VRHARTLRALSFATACGLASTGAFAGWQDEASAFDAGRLAKLDESKAKGLAEAEGGGSQSDLAVIHAALAGSPSPISERNLAGRWRCRTIKLGGITPDVVYGWFACRIAAHGDTLSFEKLTGSQRTRGTLYSDASGGYVYLGASSVSGEPAHHYSGKSEPAGAQATPDDQIGLLIATGPNSARIEFPYPVQESTFDVLELKR